MLHQLVGLLAFHQPLLLAIRQGWWGSIGPHNLEGAVMFWFFVGGFLIALWGEAFRHRSEPIRTGEWVAGAMLSLMGATAIPASGFWLVLLLCLAQGYSQWRRR